MYHRLLLVAGLLSSTGASSVQGQPERVLAFVGGDVILPCSFPIDDTRDFPTVEWSKEGLNPDVIFLYRDGCETYEMKNRAFEYRTSLVTKELKNGNVSLRISDVQLSDAGKYRCMRLWKNAPRDITTVELAVGAVSQPTLSVVSAKNRGVTVQCEASCWLPEPQVELLDEQGNNIPAEDPKREQHASGCYTVRRRVSLQRPTSRVTCRVHLPEFNQTRVSEILIPADCMWSRISTIGISVGGTALVFVAAAGLVVLLWKKCRKSAAGKQPVCRKESDPSTTSNTSENLLLLERRGVAENVENDAIEMLQRKVDDLESQLLMKDETICHLQNSSQMFTVISEFNPPVIVRGPSKSTPDVPAKPLNHPLNRDPNTSNLPSDHNPTPTASTNGNLPNDANAPQNKRPTVAVQRQNSSPALGVPFQKKHRNNSSPALMSLAHPELSSSSSANTAGKKFVRPSRSMSASSAPPDQNVRLQRRRSSVTSSLSGYYMLPDFPEE